MEQLEFLYFKYRQVAMNAILFASVITAFVSKTEKVQSLAFGLASGIALIALGESISRLRNKNAKTAVQEQ